MNREIKFKAKRKDGKGWVYGDKLTPNAIVCHSTATQTTTSLGLLLTGVIQVKPETVCQFTGLKDKNGIDIYENDKLSSEDDTVVYFNDSKSSFLIGCKYLDNDDNEDFEDLEFTDFEIEALEVIGNIHDKN